MRASVTVEDAEGEWIVSFTHRDPELLNAMKKAVPRGRHWDAVNMSWRVNAGTRIMADLCAEFEQLGAAVTKPNTLNPNPPDGGDRRTAEYWERKFRAMNDAARRQHEQIQQLIDERDELQEQLRSATNVSTPMNGWAETLFDAVGPTLRKSVFKALTTCLHPDRAGDEGHPLQQQLNAAYDKARR
ncbi:hypothetical protein [Nocardia cyriacigeorgica]|uniref:Uncharacterized protein n=1 Tax=Nocardia cyriacigeorgica TaxID=135487 RepID=A0A5R8NLW6_9NOCA|nr:hypothetical protein [Nocardia cyriacigeorgica]TLF76666.1 hypothetical protein FEK34_17335 [Nocardia cyriacigeorgica]